MRVHCQHLMLRLTLFVSVTTVVALPSFAQQLTTRTSDIGPPEQITFNPQTMAVPPPNAKDYADQKQKQLGQHFRPTIEMIPAAGIQPLADAPRPAASAVIGDPMLAPANLQILHQHALTDVETNNITSTVTEPSVAARGPEVLVTGNWFASFSQNDGNTFSYVNPSSTFPTAAGGFCCDQVAIYDRQRDVMFWYLQYITTSQGNIGRLAVAQGNDIAAQNWRYYDFSPQNVGQWANEWFDYPDLALGDDFLYITTNTFSTVSGGFTRAVVLRLPLQPLANYQGFTYRHFDTNQVGSIRPTHGATDTMYLAAHRNLSSIRVFTWPEASNNLTAMDVGVTSWNNGPRVAPGPDGKDWLGRADGRITAAGLAGNNIALGWTAAQDNTFPFPHVRVALIDKNTKSLVAQPSLWNPDFAFAYPYFAPNDAGTLAVSLHYGGGMQLHPSHAVGLLGQNNSWQLIASAIGTHGPAGMDEDNKWGDYLAVRPHGQQPGTWVATGFTLQGGSKRQDIQVKYIHFGAGTPPGGDIEDLRRQLQDLQRQLDELRAKVQQILDRLDDQPPAVQCCR